MATNMNANRTNCSAVPTITKPPLQAQCSSFEPLDKSTSNTLKRNPKMELTKPDLTKLLAYMEGELQAKDVVIATLKSERVRQLVSGAAGRAGERLDRFATGQERTPLTTLTTLAGSGCDEAEQMTSLDNLVLSQRRAQLRMCRILKEAEERHRKVIQELEEEKRKHEHDTAQGDDITYGLERERTRLKLELELEKQGKKKLEKELKKVTDILEEERSRQKQMVIMLLLDRKKFANKYLEERKRSEDLAQILAEEKSRIEMMAEGLEEESKKSLQMEAELEKQLAQFDMERQQNRVLLAKEEKRCKELAAELERSRGEAESGSLAKKGVRPPPQPPAKPTPGGPRPVQNAPGTGAGAGGAAMTSSVAKVVQPTATVSSVPVSAPTTGIARSVLPGQAVRPHETAPSPGKPTEGRGRGAPPPVPPNKPVVPPKKEAALRPPPSAPTAPTAPKAPAAAAAAATQGLSQDAGITPLAPT